MSLTVRLKNFGILKQAEFSLGDLTIICGENNTGKTYTACVLYGFLRSWRDFTQFSISNAQIQRLLTEGVLKIDLAQYVNITDQVLAETCKIYSQQLDKIFAAPEGRFQNSTFHTQPNTIDLLNKEFNREIGISEARIFRYSMNKGSPELTVTLVVEGEHGRQINPEFAKGIIDFIIGNTLFSHSFPQPFMSSDERTGVAIFRKELNFARNSLLEAMGQSDQNVNPRELLLKSYQNYLWPVRDNVDFTRQLEDVAKNKSFIAKEHPEVLADFADIIGGEYAITQNDQLYYIPKGTKLRLTMDLSSSSVRSLLNLNFYLHCAAEKGDLLIVDEPELSLHPKNQRRIARLFARLVNLGVKVFITTHSDYIVKELNTLIMLNHDKPHLKRVAEENGYQDSELVNADQVKVYVAEKALLDLEEGQKRRKRGYTLIQADIDPEFGIEVGSFDETIDAMNKIQRDIVWGAEQD